jgi:hypothetical protein
MLTERMNCRQRPACTANLGGLLHHNSTSAIRAKTHPATNPHIRPAESVTAIERSMAALMLRLITTLDFVTAIAECMFGSVLN